MIIGGLFADCVCGRLRLLTYSLIAYTTTICLSLIIITFFNPVFYILFVFVYLLLFMMSDRLCTSFTYGMTLSTSLTLLLNYQYLKSPFRSFNLLHGIIKYSFYSFISSDSSSSLHSRSFFLDRLCYSQTSTLGL